MIRVRYWTSSVFRPQIRGHSDFVPLQEALSTPGATSAAEEGRMRSKVKDSDDDHSDEGEPRFGYVPLLSAAGTAPGYRAWGAAHTTVPNARNPDPRGSSREHPASRHTPAQLSGICNRATKPSEYRSNPVSPGIAERRLYVSEPWRSADDIAAHLGVTKDTVYVWIAHKRMPAHKVGRLWKFQASEVDAWVRNGGAGAAPMTRRRRVTGE